MGRKIAGGIVVAVALLAAILYVRSRSTHDGTAGVAPGAATHSGSATIVHRADATDTDGATIEGFVVAADDSHPLAGATVALSPKPVRMMDSEGDDEPPIVVKTDASGAWRAEHVKAATYRATAAIAGYLPNRANNVTVVNGDHVTGVDFALAPGGTTVRGTISDVGGGPIADVQVTFMRDHDTPQMNHDEPEYMALSGADGTYQVSVAPGEWIVEATRADYLHARRELDVKTTPVTADFVLTPGGTIRGDVVTRQGVPVPGAKVIGVYKAGGRRAMAMFSGIAVVTSDEHGAFVLRPVHSGTIAIKASARGFASSSDTIAAVGIGEDISGVRVVVDHAFTISGTVVDGSSKPIAGVEVGAFSLGGESAQAAHPTDDKGAFDIIGVRPATYMLFAATESAVPQIGSSTEVTDKDVTGVVITLDGGVTLSGTVSPPGIADVGLGVDPAKMSFGNMFDAMKAMMAQTKSDASGAFTIHHAPKGEFAITARSETGATGKQDLDITADRSDLRITLEPRGSISGRVVDVNGKPVAGLGVSARPAKRESMMSFSPSSHRPGETAPDGSFHIVGLDPGSYNVKVSDEEGAVGWADAAHKDKPHEPQVVEVAAIDVNLTLTVEARDGVLRGHVVDASHAPIADAWVTVSATMTRGEFDPEEYFARAMHGNERPPVLTGADGAFVVDHLRQGELDVEAEAKSGRAHGSVTKVKPGDDVTIVLATLGSLIGAVTAGGAPVTPYDVSCHSASGMQSQHVTAADGTYELARLVPGTYTCTVDADAGTASGSATVADSVVHLDFTVGQWGSISGTLVDEKKSAPLVGYAVAATTSSARSMVGLFSGTAPMTDATGHFELDRVAAGKASIAAFAKKGMLEPLSTHEIDVGPGQHVDAGKLVATPAGMPPGGGSGAGSGSAK